MPRPRFGYPKAGLRLDHRMRQRLCWIGCDGDCAGKPAESALVERIMSQDPDEMMPAG